MTTGAIAGKPLALTEQTVSLDPLTADSPPIALASDRDVSTRTAGVWRVQSQSGTDERLLIVNADADAGDTTVVDPDRARDWLALQVGEVTWLQDELSLEATSELASDAGSNLSLGLFLGALVLCVVETLMARFASHADVGGSP